MGGFSGELPLGALRQKRATIKGTMLRSRTLEEKAAATRLYEKSVQSYLASGRIQTVVDAVFSLADAAEAYRLMEGNGNFGKIMLTD